VFSTERRRRGRKRCLSLPSRKKTDSKKTSVRNHARLFEPTKDKEIISLSLEANNKTD
jgi:hypothetical protein